MADLGSSGGSMTGAAGMDFSGIASDITANNAELQALSKSDLTDPANQIKMQMALSKMQEYYGAWSAMISDYKQTCMSIIQKM
jgi:hypothetical protein